jgi:hypothetical protein
MTLDCANTPANTSHNATRKEKRRSVSSNVSGVNCLEVVGASGLEPLTPTV